MRELFSTSYDAIATRVDAKIAECEDESNVENEMGALMDANRGLSNEQFVTVMYNTVLSNQISRYIDYINSIKQSSISYIVAYH